MASKKHDMAWYRTHRMNTQPPPHVDTKLPARPRYLQEKEQKPPPQAPINGFKSRLAASPATESQPTVKSSSMAAVAPAAEPPPNNTVYVRNLEERIRIPALTEALSELFSDYGTIIDLVAKASLKRKGQAFVVFDDVAAATRAIDEIQGFELFDKPMQLSYARTPSDAFVKEKGTSEEYESHRRHRLAEKERRQAVEAQQEAQNKRKRPMPEEPGQNGAPAGAQAAGGAGQPPAKKPAKGAGLKSTGGTGAVVPDEYLPPNKTLFVQNVPEEYDVEMLSAVFARYEGFREVRTVPGRTGIAFVEYEAETGAISAKEATAGMPLGDGKAIKVTFQRQ